MRVVQIDPVQIVMVGRAGRNAGQLGARRVIEVPAFGAMLTFDDARAILTGPQDSATQYFCRVTSGELTGAFRPIVSSALSGAGAMKAFQALQGRISQNQLLGQLAATNAPLQQALNADAAKALDLPPVNFDEASFRFALNQDAMATEKLAEGIRGFVTDAIKLEQLMLAL